VGSRFSAPVQNGPVAQPASCITGTGSFPGVKSSRSVTLTPHPLLVLWSRNSRPIPLLPPMGRTACTEPQCLHKGALYFLCRVRDLHFEVFTISEIRIKAFIAASSNFFKDVD